jgi:hypothetical protein
MTFREELRDAIAPRTVGLVFAVLLLQLGFILSYVGAFHHPTPNRIPIVVVAPASAVGPLVSKLNSVASEPLHATAATNESVARRQLTQGDTSGVLIVDPETKKDTLLVASAGGGSVATAVEQVIHGVEVSQQRTVAVTDAVRLQSGDARGLTGFYAVIGWIVGGYLLAALLGMAKGSRPATVRRAVFRLAATVPYALLSGIGGALILGPLLGAITGHFLALSLIGTLLVLSSATVTMAFQTLFKVAGIGVTVLVFVVLGNPSAGGAYQAPLLPPFWRAIGDALPNGAGTSAVRKAVYFDGHGLTRPMVIIAIYVLAGAVATLGASAIHRHRAAELTG